MTASALAYNVPLLASPFDSTAANSTSPSPSQMANGFIASVDVVASATQNYLHNSSTSYVWLMQQLGLMMPFNPVAGASIVATKAGGIVSLRNSSTNATEFYVAKVDMAIGYTDPSLDPTHWQLINFNEISKYAAIPVSLASASTVNIGAALSGNVTISGTTAVTAFDTITTGAIRYVTYSGAVPITYNGTSMQLIGGASRTNAVGDVSVFQSLGSGNWKELFYSGINIAFDARYALLAGLSTQLFSVANATSASHAMNRQTADARYAALAGLASQLFSAANGTSGNQVINFSQAFGLGQTPTDVTASRALGITYTNNTGKTIYFHVSNRNSTSTGVALTVNGVVVAEQYNSASNANSTIGAGYPVLNGQTYSATSNGSLGTLWRWTEFS